MDIVEGLESYAAIREAEAEILERRRSRKKGERMDLIDRVRLWFISNPGVVIQPIAIITRTDWMGDGLNCFPRGHYGTFRNICSKLRKEGLISYYRDPGSDREISGYYVLNENYLLFREGTTPEREFHGIKFDIRDPRDQRRGGIRNTKGHIIPPWKLRDILVSNSIIPVKLEENDQEHTWTYTGTWRDRRITFNIHNQRSNNVEIWLHATRNPINLDVLFDLSNDLNHIWGDIWIHSDTMLELIGINRDLKDWKLMEKPVQFNIAKSYLLRVYQKGRNVRFEAHWHGSVDWQGLKEGLQISYRDAGLFDVSKEIGTMKREIRDLREVNQLLQEMMQDRDLKTEVQTLELSRLTGTFQEFIRLLKKPEAPVDAHSSFVRGDQIDPTGYG